MCGSKYTGKNIASYRKSKRLTQAELARSVGISKNYLAVIEEGRKRPRIAVIARIAKCLGVELELLLKKM